MRKYLCDKCKSEDELNNLRRVELTLYVDHPPTDSEGAWCIVNKMELCFSCFAKLKHQVKKTYKDYCK